MSVIKDIILFLVHLTVFSFCESVKLPECDIHKLNNCGNIHGILCNESTKLCECLPDFEYHFDSPDLNTTCILKKTSDNNEGNGTSTVSLVVIILLTILLIGSALFFIVHRYKLLHWLHNKIFSHRNSGATYEDVMIGQDDPPISA